MIQSQEEKSKNNQEAIEKLNEECAALRGKLSVLQRKRQLLYDLSDKQTKQSLSEWLIRKESAERSRRSAMNEYQFAVTTRNINRRWMNLADEWNVTNDCFHIWHRGPFGTINGLRLGSEVPLQLPSQPVDQRSDPSKAAPNLNISSQTGNQNGSTNASTNNGNPQEYLENSRVPWVEINSALGLMVLLLSTIEKKPLSGITYQNKLVPQGSTSKIGIRKEESVTFYNLFSDDNFQFFGKRSFNIALNGLLRCLSDAAEVVEKMDRTMTMPYAIECDTNGSYTIGGMSVAYSPEGEFWTRAMKYVLTDAKWLVTFTTKHVDR